MLMVKSMVDKDLQKRLKALEKNAKSKAKHEENAKKELSQLRMKKVKALEKDKKNLENEIRDAKTNLEKTKAEIKANTKAVYGREKRNVKHFLRTQNIPGQIFLGLIVNLIFSIFELIGGLVSGSAAIISDSIHDLGDAISLGFSAFFERKAKHGPDKTYTYGYSRFSILGIFVTTVVLVVGASFMIYISILRIIEPTDTNPYIMLMLSVIGFIINSFVAFRTENGRFNVLKAISEKSVNGIILEDVVGWFIVMLGSVIMIATDWLWLDPVLSILISVYLICTSFTSFKKVLELFLEKVPNGISVDVIKYQVLAIPHVKGVHSIHLWSMDGRKLCATMHVVVDGKVVDGVLIENSITNPMNIKKEIRKQLRTTGINEVTLEIESEDEKCK